jgi:hypothetical protein
VERTRRLRQQPASHNAMVRFVLEDYNNAPCLRTMTGRGVDFESRTSHSQRLGESGSEWVPQNPARPRICSKVTMLLCQTRGDHDSPLRKPIHNALVYLPVNGLSEFEPFKIATSQAPSTKLNAFAASSSPKPQHKPIVPTKNNDLPLVQASSTIHNALVHPPVNELSGSEPFTTARPQSNRSEDECLCVTG